MKRRAFLKTVGGTIGAGALTVPGTANSQPAATLTEQEQVAGEMPHRKLGRTGESVSIVGFPGLALVHDEQDRCTEAIHKAFAQGVDYFDVAPAYGKGDAEIKMGIGLKGLDRDKYFLACKTKMRDARGAREELERSLVRLKTDHFDLYQMHCLIQPDEVDEALGPGGAMETILKAKEEGKVRYVGFSAHSTKSALAAMKKFRFDTVMFPINFVEFFTLGFGKPILKLAAEQGAAVLAIKPLCRGAWPEDMEQQTRLERKRRWWYRPVEDPKELDLALRFTLSQEPVVAGIPPAFLEIAEKAFAAAPSFRPIAEAEIKQLRKLAHTCNSIFRRWEEQVAHAGCPGEVIYPDSPHDCPGDWHA